MALVPTRLRSNKLTEPLAIAGRPMLSWVLEGEGQRQTAYEIEVGTTPGKNDLWDSGKVSSDKTYDIEYGGRQVFERETAHWRVRVWDEKGDAGPWSEWTTWTAGLDRWDFDWIGFDEPLNTNRPPDFMGAHWLWHPDAPVSPVPECVVVYRKSFSLDAVPDHATLLGTGDDTFLAKVNGREVGRSDGRDDSWRRPVLVDVRSALKIGENTIEVTLESHASSASGMIAKLSLSTGGERREVVTDSSWEARFSDSSDWKPAKSLGVHGIGPWGGVTVPQLFLPPPRALRREFNVAKKVRRATLYATAMGMYEAAINDQRFSDDYFAPGWTDYKKRIHYRAYDVTPMVVSGRNTIDVLLLDGWFTGYVGFGKRTHYDDQTRFSGVLWLDYADGTSQYVASDEAWVATTGPTKMSDFLMGEEHDARVTAEDWHPVVIGQQLDPVVEPYPMEPTVAYKDIAALSVKGTVDGKWIYDLGENFAGVPSLRLNGMKAGTEIVLRHAEVLNPDGTAYTTNLRSARARDVYTTRAGDQEWSPRGTFHGFRYVELSGVSEQPPLNAVGGRAVSNVARAASHFECSDPRLNQLWANIDRTFRSNFIEIPTDCPQRDERLGWTGDIQVFCRTAMLLADVQTFLDKWLLDMSDAQRADGQYPMFAPVLYGMDDGGPAWADAGMIVPWALYEVYGDVRVLDRQYDSMKRFVDFCLGRMVDGMPPKEFHCFGDWLNVGVETPLPVLFKLYAGRSTWILSEAAHLTGRKEDARKYGEAFRALRLRFRAAFVDDEGWVQGKSQTGQAMALAFDMVEDRTSVFARLAEDVEKRGHLTTGFIGTKDLMLELRDGGRTDLAYRLLLSDDYPGWLFSIKHGATSIWERWNGWTPDKGFGDPGMNSFAHYAFGAVGQFMMETIGGIRLLRPGYERFIIHVERGPLEWANCWFDSPRGRIATSWNGRKLTVTVPPNTEADVRLPNDDVTVLAGTHEFEI